MLVHFFFLLHFNDKLSTESHQNQKGKKGKEVKEKTREEKEKGQTVLHFD